MGKISVKPKGKAKKMAEAEVKVKRTSKLRSKGRMEVEARKRREVKKVIAKAEVKAKKMAKVTTPGPKVKAKRTVKAKAEVMVKKLHHKPNPEKGPSLVKEIGKTSEGTEYEVKTKKEDPKTKKEDATLLDGVEKFAKRLGLSLLNVDKRGKTADGLADLLVEILTAINKDYTTQQSELHREEFATWKEQNRDMIDWYMGLYKKYKFTNTVPKPIKMDRPKIKKVRSKKKEELVGKKSENKADKAIPKTKKKKSSLKEDGNGDIDNIGGLYIKRSVKLQAIAPTLKAYRKAIIQGRKPGSANTNTFEGLTERQQRKLLEGTT